MKASEVIKRYETYCPQEYLWKVIVVACKLHPRQGN